MSDEVRHEAQTLAGLLFDRKLRVVFAESCTAGLVAASLASVPGISEHLCGSLVTYRNGAKTAWLRVSEDDLERFTAVSDPVARQMAAGALYNTAEADWSAAITGHLGPNAPEGQDGLVFIAVSRRHGANIETQVERHHLKQPDRLARQHEAAALVLRSLAAAMASADPPGKGEPS